MRSAFGVQKINEVLTWWILTSVSMTGIPSRTLFNDPLSRIILRACRHLRLFELCPHTDLIYAGRMLDNPVCERNFPARYGDFLFFFSHCVKTGFPQLRQLTLFTASLSIPVQPLFNARYTQMRSLDCESATQVGCSNPCAFLEKLSQH